MLGRQAIPAFISYSLLGRMPASVGDLTLLLPLISRDMRHARPAMRGGAPRAGECFGAL